ncbi:MAG: prepilin-type N-terminal cleavage/methylation domain-containing protein [Acidobacteria bacterium]|nr:prepilin-type N-terminal cleavage/methylation domain-containing protein [Acidobacteriota bacterium]
MPAPSKRDGFTLMEVAIAIAVMAILAGTAVPLLLKSVNQAKEQRARIELKQLYEACFGAPDRNVPGMQGDFGFPNGVATPNLAIATAATGTRLYGTYAGSPLLGGWRGPYWSGSTLNTGLPSDPWGRAYLIRQVTGGFQITTRGPNGQSDVLAGNPSARVDDLVYPNPTLPAPSGTVQVTTVRHGNLPVVPSAISATPPSRTNVLTPVLFSLVAPPPVPPYSRQNLPAGPLLITVTIPGGQPAVLGLGLAAQTAPQTQSRLVTLAPGGTQNLTFTFN